MMRILLASNLYPPLQKGGAEAIVHHLASELSKKGHDVAVLTTGRSGLDHTNEDGVSIYRFRPSGPYYFYDKEELNPSRIKKLAWHLWDLDNKSSYDAAKSLIQTFDPDVLHTHNIAGLSPAVWRAAHHSTIPIVHTAHDYHLLCTRSTMLDAHGEICTGKSIACREYSSWYRRKSSALDIFCSPSRFLLNLHRQKHVTAKEFRVVRNGIPVLQLPSTIPNRAPGPRFLYIGQLATHKGISDLLAAFSSLDDTNIRLDIAGAGVMAQDVRAAAAADARITYHGRVSEHQKWNLLQHASVFVLPTRWFENAPVTVIEAFRAGLPVVASNIGGVPEMVCHDINGLLTRPGDRTELARALGQLASDTILLERLRRGALNQENSYTVAQMTDEYIRIYSDAGDLH